MALKLTSSSWRVLRWRARFLLALMGLLLLFFVFVLMYARGVFEATQRLTLVTDDAEGVTVGMSLTFSGFPIGRVRRISLAQNGDVHIQIDVPKRDAQWLREISVFTLERSLIGGTKLRAYTGLMDSPPLPDGAVRPVLRGDALADLPRVVNTVRELLEQIKSLTAPDAALAASLHELHGLLVRIQGPGGLLQAVLGEADRQRVTDFLAASRVTLSSADGVLRRAEALVQHADQRLLAPQGMVEDAQNAVREMHGLLVDLRRSLQRIDAVVDDAHGLVRNARAASEDLDLLRSDVEVTLQRVDALLQDVQRRWPFARPTEGPLP